MKIPAKADQIARLEKALKIATQQSNHKLATSIREILQNQYNKAVKPAAGSDCNVTSANVKAVYDLKKMSLKNKRELYDDKIIIDSPEVIAAKLQWRRVLARRISVKPFTNKFGVTVA